MTTQLDFHAIREIYRRFEAREPEPKGELDHLNAYTLLVAVALSAQAMDKGVNEATAALIVAAAAAHASALGAYATPAALMISALGSASPTA